jgi:excisionase family DNA binding protein
MTLEEVATWLRVTPRTIYRMLEEDQIPAFKIRGAWRFRRDEIERMTRVGRKAQNERRKRHEGNRHFRGAGRPW